MNEPDRAAAGIRRVALVVPTLRRSRWWKQSIEAACTTADRWLHEDPEREAVLVVVDQSGRDAADDRAGRSQGSRCAIDWLAIDRPLGFARAANRGWHRATEFDAELVGWINDDLLVDPDWLQLLIAALEAGGASAMQGLVLDAEAETIDSAGVAWNAGHQAMQLRHGETAGAWARSRDAQTGELSDPGVGARVTDALPLRIAAVSAAAALYRVDALEEVSAQSGPFDEHLDTFYEDVDLALRLADQGHSCAFLWSAQARHLGSATAGADPAGKAALLVGNRWRVVMKAAGRDALLHAPRALLRDLVDLARGRLSRLGVLRGWRRALAGVRHCGHLGRPGNGWQHRAEPSTAQMTASPRPAAVRIQAVVVHWHTEEALGEMLASWQRALAHPELEAEATLTVVDNGSQADHLALASWRPRFEEFEHWSAVTTAEAARLLWLQPGSNLGFGRAVNWGALATRNGALTEREDGALEVVLLLNPDVVLDDDFLVELVRAARARWTTGAREAEPTATVGLVPALRSDDGSSQAAWQLRPLPRPIDLLAHACFLPGRLGPDQPPAFGVPIEQPAAAALAIESRAFDALGGFDEGFRPAWYEDVDFAARASDAGWLFRYLPTATAVHRQGESVNVLGYGRFLRIYGRNLRRYARRRHGALFAGLVGMTIRKAAFARLLSLMLPLRAPRRASGRLAAARALLSVAFGEVDPKETPR